MAANNTPATAIDITALLDYTVTLDPSGTEGAYPPSCSGAAWSPVWWKYTAPTGITALGISVSLGVGTDYYPQFSVWQGTLPTLVERVNTCAIFFDPTTFQIAVQPGETYYFQVVDGNENDPPPVGQTITFAVEEPPNEILPAGTLLIANDFANLPAAFLDATNGDVLSVRNLPAFECADILPSGVIGCAAEKADDSFDVESFSIFTQDMDLLIENSAIVTDPTQNTISPVTSNRIDTFWVAFPAPSAPSSRRTYVRQVEDDGTVDPTTWTLPVDGDLTPAIAVNAAGTILYYVDSGFDGFTRGAIHRYDLTNDVPLSDLVAPDTDRFFGRDLLLLDDDTLIVTYRTTASGTTQWFVNQYDLSGSVLETITLPTTTSAPPRICRGLDDPDSFWSMTFGGPSPFTNTFTNLLISDGSTIVDFTVPQRGDGDQDGPMFGPPQSCPLLLLPAEVDPLPPPAPADQAVVNGLTVQCVDGTVTIDGANFEALATVALTADGNAVTSVVSVLSDTEILLTNLSPEFVSGTYCVIVTNPAASPSAEVCSALACGISPPTPFPPDAGVTYPMRVLRRSPTFSTEKMWNFFSRFEIDFQAGAPRDGNDPIQFCLRYSDDAGNTWSDEMWVEADVKGGYGYVCDWWRLGRGRDRVWEISSTSPAMIVLLAAYIDAEPGAF